MFCWKCGLQKEGPIAFREQCEKCGVDLHCCKGCRFYQVGRCNDCVIPDTQKVVDRYAYQFCEDFAPIQTPPASEEVSKKKRFEDLFT